MLSFIKFLRESDERQSYTVRPKTKSELIKIVKSTIKEKGNNCDLNFIDTSLITDFNKLFDGCSRFNGDISRWDVSRCQLMVGMFSGSKFNSNISEWNVSNVEDMWGMFNKSTFNQDISKWKLRKDCKIVIMFDKCPIKEEYKPKYLI